MLHRYNDSELLYLMYEECEIAQGILFEKYSNLIKRRLLDFKINYKYFDDFYQEGLMMLYKAFYTYNPYYGKTFNKYFDMILQRRIIAILRKEKNYFYNVVLIDEFNSFMAEESEIYAEEYNFNFNKVEKVVFDLHYKQNKQARIIAKELKLDIKKIYNTLYSVKKKIRQTSEKLK